jgi:hypothetical protein
MPVMPQLANQCAPDSLPVSGAESLRSLRALPDTRAEAFEVIGAVGGAITAVLTPHQRAGHVALTLDDVPIDVLAERRATPRGALYKNFHDARRKLWPRLTQHRLAIEGQAA